MSILLGSVTINPNSTGGANTKSAWQTIATHTATLYGVTVLCIQSTSNGGTHAFDIGYGATPTVVVENMPGWTGQLVHRSYLLDVTIPANEAFKFRVQYANASLSTITWYFFGHETAGNRTMFDSIKCLNINTGTTAPTATLTGNTTTANTEGAWVEISSSLPAAANAFHVIPQTDNVTYAGIYLIDVTTGAPGSEATTPLTITQNFPARRVSGNTVNYNPGVMFASIAAGERIAARVQADTATAGSRDLPVFFVAAYGGTSGGGGSTTIIQGSGMQRILKDGETTAGRKRVFFDIRDTAGAGWTGSVTGVKAKLSTNGGTAADSTNDIVRVTTPLHYVELSDAEAAAAAAGDVIAAWVPAGSGYLASTIGYLEITSENPTTQTVTDIANAVVEAEITAIKTYNRSADTTATIDGPTSGTNSLGVTTDASYNPIKTL